MPSFIIRKIEDDSVFIDAEYDDGFNHSNMRVIVGQNIGQYTDAADLQAKLSAYVQMRVDEQKARAAAGSVTKAVQTLVGKTVKVLAPVAVAPKVTLPVV